MAEEQDPKVSSAYRELGAEEPPRALDEAILAAARRTRISPAKPWTQRYAVPLGLAAVLVLSVTVTLRMQQERPGIESPASAEKQTAAMAPAPVAQEALKLKPEQQIKSAAPRARSAPQGEPKPFADMPREQAAAAAAPAAAPAPAASTASAAGGFASRADRVEAGRGMESSVTGPSARQAEERTSRDAEAAARAPQVGPLRALAKSSAEGQLAKTAGETPEAELERIALLRRDGRHEDADKALADFRKRFPDYKMTEAMRERVERR